MYQNSWRSHRTNTTKNYAHSVHGVHPEDSEISVLHLKTLIVDILISIVCTVFKNLVVDNTQVRELLNVQSVSFTSTKKNDVALTKQGVSAFIVVAIL